MSFGVTKDYKLKVKNLPEDTGVNLFPERFGINFCQNFILKEQRLGGWVCELSQ